MTFKLPKDFVDLDTAMMRKSHELSNVMGRVTDFLPPRPSNGTDFQSKFDIAEIGTFGGGETAKFFRKDPSDHPKILGTGDVVVLWNVKAWEFSYRKYLLSNHASSWLVFHQKDIPEKADLTDLRLKFVKDKKAQEPTQEIMRYAIALCNDGIRESYTEPINQVAQQNSTSGTVGVAPTPRNRFALIKDVEVRKYYDLVALVVKVYHSNNNVDLHVTDYTSHPMLYNFEKDPKSDHGAEREGDEYGYVSRTKRKHTDWSGPPGKLTMTVTLWPPHCDWASTHVKVGDIVSLRNTHIKISNVGTIEGVLHTDQKFENQVDISVIRKDKEADDRVKDLWRRKKDFEKRVKEELKDSGKDVNGLKRQTDDSSEQLSKAQKKRKRKQEQLEKATNGDSKAKGNANAEIVAESKPKEPVGTVAAIRAARNEINKNIKSQNPDHPTRTVAAILDTSKTHLHTPPSGIPFVLPFMNVKFKATVRIIDFYPHNLADFTFRYKIPEESPLSDGEDSNSDSDSGSDISSGEETPPPPSSMEDSDNRRWKWEWQFFLLCEDIKPTGPKERIKICVTKEGAECLLKLDACNLRKHPSALSELRERLFILWGDLEERKRHAESLGLTLWHHPEAFKAKNAEKGITSGWGEGERPKSRPFTCCIAEYGQKRKEDKQASGKWERVVWERVFRLFGTTIA